MRIKCENSKRWHLLSFDHTLSVNLNFSKTHNSTKLSNPAQISMNTNFVLVVFYSVGSVYSSSLKSSLCLLAGMYSSSVRYHMITEITVFDVESREYCCAAPSVNLPYIIGKFWKFEDLFFLEYLLFLL